MTAEARATTALHDAADAYTATLYKAVGDLTVPLAAMIGATNIVAAIRASANMILALEAIEDAAIEAGKRLRATLGEIMNDNGVPTIATEAHLISCYEPSPRAVVMDEHQIPQRFWITPDPKIDMTALARALRDAPVPGAALSNGGAPVVRISTKKEANR